jgi:pimeloyl-ACP methyl ester carboxylesterase
LSLYALFNGLYPPFYNGIMPLSLVYEICFMLIMAISTSTHATAQQQGYMPVNGINMYYEIYGTGQPLVLIHGGGSTLHTSFGAILPLLAKNRQVIGVELQAHGHTSDRNAPETFEQDADDVAAFLKQLNIPAADIFGFSNGGNTGMQLAIRHTERVRRLVLASAFYKKEGMQPGFWDFMKNADISMMPQVYKDVYLALNPGNTKGLQAMHDKDLQRMQTFIDWSDADLKSIKAPAFVIVGDRDVVRVEHALQMQQLIANSRLAVLPATHGSYMGEIMTPDVNPALLQGFVAMVEEFLDTPISGQ